MLPSHLHVRRRAGDSRSGLAEARDPQQRRLRCTPLLLQVVRQEPHQLRRPLNPTGSRHHISLGHKISRHVRSAAQTAKTAANSCCSCDSLLAWREHVSTKRSVTLHSMMKHRRITSTACVECVCDLHKAWPDKQEPARVQWRAHLRLASSRKGFALAAATRAFAAPPHGSICTVSSRGGCCAWLAGSGGAAAAAV